MRREAIARDDFIRRLTALCVRSPVRSIPRRRSARGVLLMSIVQRLVPGRTYSQPEINRIIREWLRCVAPLLETDHVSLRRYLVDEGFLERETGGVTYRRGRRPPWAIAFTPEVERLDVQSALGEARRGIAARRDEYRRQHRDESAG